MSETSGQIEVGPCRCPGEIHGTDWVELHPELTLDGGLLVAGGIGPDSGLSELEIGPAIMVGLMRTEIRAWSFVDEQGPVPILPTTIRLLLPFARGGAVVANAIAPRIGEAAQTDPFKVARTPKSSGTGPTRKPPPSRGSISPSSPT